MPTTTTLYLRLQANRREDGTVEGIRSGTYTRNPPEHPMDGSALLEVTLTLPDDVFDPGRPAPFRIVLDQHFADPHDNAAAERLEEHP